MLKCLNPPIGYSHFDVLVKHRRICFPTLIASRDICAHINEAEQRRMEQKNGKKFGMCFYSPFLQNRILLTRKHGDDMCFAMQKKENGLRRKVTISHMSSIFFDKEIMIPWWM